MRHIVAALLVAVAVALPRAEQQTPRAEPRPGAPPARIVSLVPAASEMLFGMGAGDQIAGVGSYDQVPGRYRRLARVEIGRAHV